MQISPNFSLKELTVTSSKLPNNPNETELAYLKALCTNILEPLRKKFGPIIVKSAFRSVAVNMAVKGASNSQHVKGQAADIESAEGVPNAELYEYIVNNLPFDQVIAEKLSKSNGSAGWIHVSYIPRGRRSKLSFVNGKYVEGFKYEN